MSRRPALFLGKGSSCLAAGPTAVLSKAELVRPRVPRKGSNFIWALSALVDKHGLMELPSFLEQFTGRFPSLVEMDMEVLKAM